MTQAAKVLFAHLQPGQSQILKGDCTVWGCAVVVEALRLEGGKLLTVIASVGTAHPIQDYTQRWGIETLFSAFKTRGFCLESTHFQDSERLSKLFALLTLALCWAMRTGEFVAEKTPITIKKHGRKAKSIFCTGLDHIRHLLLNPSPDHYQAFKCTLAFLALPCTSPST